jgi:phage terminase large subunit GpA-like protein
MINRNVRRFAKKKAALCKPKPKLTGLEYSNRYSYLTGLPGGARAKWHTRPYQEPWMNWFTYSWAETSWNMKSARVGYSAAFKTGFVQYYSHWKPSSIGIYHPTGDDRDRYVKKEINTHFDENSGAPCLKGLLSNSKSKTSVGENTVDLKILSNGTTLFNLNAGVPREMRAITLNRVGIEEPSAYHSLVEGDTIALILKRMSTVPDPKCMAGGTPVFPNDYTHQGFLKGDQQYRYYPCPHCGHYQQLRWRQFIKEGPDAAKMKCENENCEELIENESLRWMDKRAGQACPLGLDRSQQVLKNGYPVWLSSHVWAAMGYDRGAKWTEIIAEYKTALEQMRMGNPDPMQTFHNTVLGIPWEDSITSKLTAEGLLKRRNDETTGNAYPPADATWDVPNGVVLICYGVDTQGGDGSANEGFQIHVWGFGLGEEMWHIASQWIAGDPTKEATLNELDAYASIAWRRQDGAELTMALGAIDEGGHATEQVRRWCSTRVGRWVPVKGRRPPGNPNPANLPPMLGKGTPVNYTGKNKAAAKAGKDLLVYLIGYEQSVNDWQNRLRIEVPGPGYVHFGQAATEGILQEMFPWKRMPGKVRAADGGRVYSWVKPRGARDEAGDCARYARAAMLLIRRRYSQPQRMWDDYGRRALASIGRSGPAGNGLLSSLTFG